ncbi:MAG: hypothetical protein JWR03_169 [Cohnella sp.]|nr:hypothetical protein [Cohnella sp.]
MSEPQKAEARCDGTSAFCGILSVFSDLFHLAEALAPSDADYPHHSELWLVDCPEIRGFSAQLGVTGWWIVPR